MRLASPEQMRDIDKRMIEGYQVPGLLLMENAAAMTAQAIGERWPAAEYPRAAVVCGAGNNGGDGLAIARLLHGRGYRVRVWLLAKAEALKGDAAANAGYAKALGIPLEDGGDTEALVAGLAESDLIVDAIFGTGLARQVTGAYASAIEAINAAGKPVVAVDIPSGIDGRTGQILGCAVRAAHTVAFGLAKTGQLLYPGRTHTGELIVAPIGIAPDCVDQAGPFACTYDAGEIRGLLPHRDVTAHKGDCGHVGIIAGSAGMAGAAGLCALGAVRGGAGRVSLACPASAYNQAVSVAPEAMGAALPADEKGRLAKSALSTIDAFLEGKSAVALGPGWGRGGDLSEIASHILAASPLSMVVDADGLYAVKDAPDVWASRRGPTVITPHPGEMAYLTGESAREIATDPMAVACSFAQRHGVVVALKGAATVVASPEGSAYINATGNPGMATGGSGDVLCGLIAALMGQGMAAYEAAVLGVWLHGRAGDLAAERTGVWALAASDIAASLPDAWRSLI